MLVNMGENLLRIALDELGIIRIRCQKCGIVVELPIDKIGSLDNEFCPGKCGTPWGRGVHTGSIGSLGIFANAVQNLRQMTDVFAIEFPLQLDGREESAK